ncbi:MAG: FlgD immunoglobulin-like domain containing protein [Fidelibacterota bacterium]
MWFIHFAVAISLLITFLFSEDKPESDLALIHRWSLDEDGSGFLQISIDSDEEIAGLQFTLEASDPKIFLGTPVVEVANDHFIVKSKADSNELRIIGFSLQGKPLDLDTPILTIPMLSSKARDQTVKLMIKDIIASSPKGTKINLRVSDGEVFVIPTLPKKLKLEQNYPNPFSGKTRINFDLPEDAVVNLKVMDILGNTVRALRKGIVPAGFYTILWDGRTDDGLPVEPGEYLCSLQVGTNQHTMKMVALRKKIEIPQK